MGQIPNRFGLNPGGNVNGDARTILRWPMNSFPIIAAIVPAITKPVIHSVRRTETYEPCALANGDHRRNHCEEFPIYVGTFIKHSEADSRESSNPV